MSELQRGVGTCKKCGDTLDYNPDTGKYQHRTPGGASGWQSESRGGKMKEMKAPSGHPAKPS